MARRAADLTPHGGARPDVKFRRRTDNELQTLADQALIDYIRAAARAEDGEAARRGLAILVYGLTRNVRLRVRAKLNDGLYGPDTVEDVAQEAIARAIGAAFDGSSEGEFRSWLNTITDRAAIDFVRRERKRPEERPIPDDHERRPHFRSAGDHGTPDTSAALEAVLAAMKPAHRRVIELHVLEDRPAAEVCAIVEGMTPDNVAQVTRRFRLAMRRRLDADGP